LTASIRFTVLAAVLLPSAYADSLEAILGRMDRAAKTFTSVSTTLKQTEYTAVIHDLSPTESGQLRIKRGKNGLNAIIELTDPEPRTIVVKGHEAQIYHPKANTLEKYDVSKWASTMDQFLLLAFGTSGADLRKNYDVKLGGAETIDGTPTTRLDLTPKTEELKKVISKVELWIPEGGSNAIREKVTETTDDYYLVNYSNVNPRANVPDSAFDLKLPKGVHIVNPQH
jgi:outer membrane lipoprotein-sorting protein